MTETNNKFFFLCFLTATQQGKSVLAFNTIASQVVRNLTAASLANIQDTGAKMLNESGVPFDNIVISNIVFLAETTEEEFFRYTPVKDSTADEIAAAVAASMSPEAQAEGEMASANEAVDPAPAVVEDAAEQVQPADDGDHSHDDRIV